MTTPPPVPPENPAPSVPPPVPSAQPPPVPAAVPPAPAQGNETMEKLATAFRKVDWHQHASDAKRFASRFAAGDFSVIKPAPHEEAAVAGLPERVAANAVWRRALLWMAFVLSIVLLLKNSFDPLTVRASVVDSEYEALNEKNPSASRSELKEAAEKQADEQIKVLGESNVQVIDGLLIGQMLALIASAVLQFMAARAWKERVTSQRYAMWAVGVLLLFQLAVMLIPWSSMMNFKHLEGQFAAQGIDGALGVAQMKTAMQGVMAVAVLGTAVPFFYGLFNGILRASLAAKTLVPASIVCGWASILLAVTISMPWFIILSIVDQFQPDILIFLGVLCLLAAPLSLVVKSRRLGAPLTSEEATPIVKRSRLLLTALNLAGITLLVIYLSEKDLVKVSKLISSGIQYFAHLMLVSVVAVDILVRILDRAHRKLAGDSALDESLRQIGDALPK